MGRLGGLGGFPGLSWKPWRAPGRRHGRPGPSGVGVVHAGGRCRRGRWPLRKLQRPCQTALGILPRLNVPGGTVADFFWQCVHEAEWKSVNATIWLKHTLVRFTPSSYEAPSPTADLAVGYYVNVASFPQHASDILCCGRIAKCEQPKRAILEGSRQSSETLGGH